MNLFAIRKRKVWVKFLSSPSTLHFPWKIIEQNTLFTCFSYELESKFDWVDKI